jgi:hypothetical protein
MDPLIKIKLQYLAFVHVHFEPQTQDLCSKAFPSIELYEIYISKYNELKTARYGPEFIEYGSGYNFSWTNCYGWKYQVLRTSAPDAIQLANEAWDK